MSIDLESYVSLATPIVPAEVDLHWNPAISKYVLHLSEDTRVHLTAPVAQRLLGQLLAQLIGQGDAVDFAQIASIAVVELKNAAAELKWANAPDASARLGNTIAQLGYLAEAVKAE